MRLICPNCNARYDVADDVIPKGGRDVQCSSCTKTWFQMDVQAAPEDDQSKPLLTPTPPSQPKSVDAGAPMDARDTEAKPRRPLDSAVANILREEAARDGNAPGGAGKTPPATQAARPTESVSADETRKRIASMTQTAGGAVAAGGAAAAATADADTNLRSVPDIHEINAALRARAEAADTSGLNPAEKEEAEQRSGFRRGFFIVLLLIAILITPYFFADQITENLPQTRPFMAQYVLTVDQARVWLDGQFANISEMVRGFTSG